MSGATVGLGGSASRPERYVELGKPVRAEVELRHGQRDLLKALRMLAPEGGRVDIKDVARVAEVSTGAVVRGMKFLHNTRYIESRQVRKSVDKFDIAFKVSR